MTSEEYIKTFDVCGHKIDLGLDDYGQCFFIEYEENGQKKGLGLGTYNESYMEEIYGLFDPVYNDLELKKKLLDYGETKYTGGPKKGQKIEWMDSDQKLYDQYVELFNEEYDRYALYNNLDGE